MCLVVVVLNAGLIFMSDDLHKDRYRYPPSSEDVTFGANSSKAPYPESGYIFCRRCGFRLNKNRHPRGFGDGISATTDSYVIGGLGWGLALWGGSWGYDGTLLYYGDPTVSEGCPMCGTFEYD